MAKAHDALAKGDYAAAWRHLDKVDSDKLLSSIAVAAGSVQPTRLTIGSGH